MSVPNDLIAPPSTAELTSSPPALIETLHAAPAADFCFSSTHAEALAAGEETSRRASTPLRSADSSIYFSSSSSSLHLAEPALPSPSAPPPSSSFATATAAASAAETGFTAGSCHDGMDRQVLPPAHGAHALSKEKNSEEFSASPCVRSECGDNSHKRVKIATQTQFIGKDSTRPKAGKGAAESQRTSSNCEFAPSGTGVALDTSQPTSKDTKAPFVVSSTRSFWFNGQPVRVDTLQSPMSGTTEEGRSKSPITRLVWENNENDTWVGLDDFCLPCQFQRRKVTESAALSTCPDVLVQSAEATSSSRAGLQPAVNADGDRACDRKTFSAAAASAVTREERWVSAVEDVVSARILAQAHQQLFSWSGGTAAVEGQSAEKVAPVLTAPLDAVGKEGSALLQWWLQHH